MTIIVPVLIVALSMSAGAGAVVFLSERFREGLSFAASAVIGAAVGGVCALAHPAKAFDGGAIYGYLGAGILSCLILNRVVKWAKDA